MSDADHATTVFVVDDRIVPRLAAKAMFTELPGFRHVGEAATGEEALRVIPHLRPELVLVDVDMPGMDGPTLVRQLADSYPELKLLAWTVSEASEDLVGMFRAGCIGYVLKDSSPSEVRRALEATMRGEAPVPRRMVPAVLRELRGGRRSPDSDVHLTDRERAVLQLLAKGEARKSIASKLGVAVTSVDTHMKNLYRKLNVSSQTEAVNAALRSGLISLDDL